ncbi:MAG: phosphate transport system regulatory protein PhoU, partial [Nitrospirae bacterium]
MKHLQRAIENLKKKILSLCAVVEENVQMAVRSIQDRDPMLARRVIEEGIQIDQMEVDIEEECLKMLSLYQPVAIDLRFIVAVLKINSELERIGDLAENISERALFLVKHEKVNIPFDFPGMTEKTISMLNKSIDSLINMDATLAH